MKFKTTFLTIMLAIFAAFSIASPALATEQAAASGGLTFATIAGFVLALWPHVVALLPAKVKDKIPCWLLWIIDRLAANYGSAKNEPRSFRNLN